MMSQMMKHANQKAAVKATNDLNAILESLNNTLKMFIENSSRVIGKSDVEFISNIGAGVSAGMSPLGIALKGITKAMNSDSDSSNLGTFG